MAMKAVIETGWAVDSRSVMNGMIAAVFNPNNPGAPNTCDLIGLLPRCVGGGGGGGGGPLGFECNSLEQPSSAPIIPDLS